MKHLSDEERCAVLAQIISDRVRHSDAECGACSGKGEVEAYEFASKGRPSDLKELPCPYCGGRGYGGRRILSVEELKKRLVGGRHE